MLIQTSYQWEPVFKYRAQRGSDLEKTSMSKRFSQEMVSSTLVAKWVAPGPRGPPEAMAVFLSANTLQMTHNGVSLLRF